MLIGLATHFEHSFDAAKREREHFKILQLIYTFIKAENWQQT